MAEELVKSHSNYIKKSFHQSIDDGGIIYERDYMTIGERNRVSSVQVPLYNSTNFLITTAQPDTSSKMLADGGWDFSGITIDNVINSQYDTSSDAEQIKIHPDYYNLRSFSYFGSCSELVRASINDILNRFPGELYGSDIPGYYRAFNNGSGTTIDPQYLAYTLPDDAGVGYILDNPFGINIHTEKMNKSEIIDPLKYFANEGYKNYQINGADITSWTISANTECIMYKDPTAVIKINDISIYYYVGPDTSVYLVDSANTGLSIRPKQEFLDKFFNTLDTFESIILDRNTLPKYTAKFLVISESDRGYEKKMEIFTFPTSLGGYNIGGNSVVFGSYITTLSNIALFYDERFCDNLYRRYTHESIKNMDWTQRVVGANDEGGEEYSENAQKIEKIIRIAGRMFDDLKYYTDNIKNVNTITYNDSSNVPDYFLTDVLNTDGWDFKNIYPVVRTNFVSGSPEYYNYTFKSNPEMSGITPYFSGYSSESGGSIIYCDCSAGTHVVDSGMTGETYVDCTGTVRYRVKPYFSDKEYKASEINTLFSKYLALSNKEILRHKGTENGIEMLLSLFGLKSKRWMESVSGYNTSYSSTTNPLSLSGYDFEVKEYVTVTEPIRDEYLSTGSYSPTFYYDWYNSKKTITYNTEDFANGIYIPYQGLPVIYSANTDDTERLLFPFFDKDAIYDGDPYYQMNGGWLSKYPFQFDVTDTLVLSSLNANSGDPNLYTETLRNIKYVNDLRELVSIPKEQLHDNSVVFVNDLSSTIYAVFENSSNIYEVKTDNRNGALYVPFRVSNNTAMFANNFLLGTVMVSDEDGSKVSFNLDMLQDGTEIRIYLYKSGDTYTASLINDSLEVNLSELCINGKIQNSPDEIKANPTNYFLLKCLDNSGVLGSIGCQQLGKNSPEYHKINAITDYYNGNNPHNGKMKYDDGFDYLDNFRHLFKYAYENDRFDMRCFSSQTEIKDAYENFGFSGLLNGDDDCWCPIIVQPSQKIALSGASTTFNTFAINKTWNIGGKPTTIDSLSKTSANTDTYRVVNTKRIDIIFNTGLNGDYKNPEMMEKIKYIDSVIVPYLSQMIPSDAICHIQYG
jgi:hypothetical protein